MARRVRAVLVAAVTLHSLLLGTALLAAPGWALGLSGWSYDGSPFFPQQAGLFLLLLGIAYGLGLFRPGLGWFLVVSKASAAVFLAAEYLAGVAPAAVLEAGLLDGLMGLLVAAALVWERRAGRAIRSERPPAA